MTVVLSCGRGEAVELSFAPILTPLGNGGSTVITDDVGVPERPVCLGVGVGLRFKGLL